MTASGNDRTRKGNDDQSSNQYITEENVAIANPQQIFPPFHSVDPSESKALEGMTRERNMT